MNSIILHHYPQSPVAEKVRVCLGIKQLKWHSVIIPRIPPKPDLMPLTGGYRRTPVMQIGANIYCDSTRIINELEQRFPSDINLFPSRRTGLDWATARWSDGVLFNQIIAIVLGSVHDSLPTDFAEDRGRLYFGPQFDLSQIALQIPSLISQVSAQFALMNQQLETSPYMSGDKPGYLDAICYYLIWFLDGRYEDGNKIISRFPHLKQWSQKISAIGHGTETSLESIEALKIATQSEPDRRIEIDPYNAELLVAKQNVSIVPDDDGGDPPVVGKLLRLNHQTISILREEPSTGNTAVNFPRIGYRVTAT